MEKSDDNPPEIIRLTDDKRDQLYDIECVCGGCRKQIVYNDPVGLCFDCSSFYCKSCYADQHVDHYSERVYPLSDHIDEFCVI